MLFFLNRGGHLSSLDLTRKSIKIRMSALYVNNVLHGRVNSHNEYQCVQSDKEHADVSPIVLSTKAAEPSPTSASDVHLPASSNAPPPPKQ